MSKHNVRWWSKWKRKAGENGKLHERSNISKQGIWIPVANTKIEINKEDKGLKITKTVSDNISFEMK